jgi:TRAP-type C4-dicarboxylate transport system permease small subunit
MYIQEAEMLKKVFAITSYIGGASVVCLALLTGTDVVGRYFFNRPVRGTIDLIEILMGVLFASGIAVTTALDDHITVDSLYDLLPSLGQLILRVLGGSICTFIFFILVWQGYQGGMLAAKSGKVSPTLDIPLFPFKFFLAIGFLVSLIYSIRQLILLFRRKPSAEQRDIIAEEVKKGN